MARIHNLLIQQGATLSESLVWRDASGARQDLTGYSARAQVRANYRATEAALTLDSDQEAEDAEGTIELDGATGEITLTAPAAATAAIELRRNEGVWDLELTKEGDVIRPFQGKVRLSPEATQ